MGIMGHSQQQLTAFSEQSNTATSPDNDQNTGPTSENVEIDSTETEFRSPRSYPHDQIKQLALESVTFNLCVENGTVSPTFQTIAGTGGMGSAKHLPNATDIVEVATACVGLPVLLTGGGMNTPMGSGAVLGRLQAVDSTESRVSVELYELFRQQGAARHETRKAKLGAYELSVPASAADCQAAIDALSAWEADEIDYLVPAKRKTQQLITERLETFESLSPADKLDTPAYSSRLEVVSEPFETYTVIPRGTLSNRTIEVKSVVVNNPNGGYYQLGIETTPTGRNSSVLSCYLGSSTSTPPTPNTAFTRDKKFKSTEMEVTPIEHPPDPEVVAPDVEVIESPLPETRLRTPIIEIDGIGEKTAMKLHRATTASVSAESIAHTFFGDGDVHASAQDEIKEILESLPQKSDIYEQLKGHTPK